MKSLKYDKAKLVNSVGKQVKTAPEKINQYALLQRVEGNHQHV
jgi:hypothetical protein